MDDPVLIEETIAALEQVAAAIPVLFPVHPRTRQRLAALNGAGPKLVQLAPPLPYTEFLSLQSGAAAIVTDSGGIQEESTALGVRCFTLRDNTERPVTVTLGTNEILGLDPAALARSPASAKPGATSSRLSGTVTPASGRQRRSSGCSGVAPCPCGSASRLPLERRFALATAAQEPTL